MATFNGIVPGSIDDSTTSELTTWSSQKIAETEAGSGAVIDDSQQSSSTTYSSQKIESELATKPEIDDTTPSQSSIYSSQKIEDITTYSYNDFTITNNDTKYGADSTIDLTSFRGFCFDVDHDMAITKLGFKRFESDTNNETISLGLFTADSSNKLGTLIASITQPPQDGWYEDTVDVTLQQGNRYAIGATSYSSTSVGLWEGIDGTQDKAALAADFPISNLSDQFRYADAYSTLVDLENTDPIETNNFVPLFRMYGNFITQDVKELTKSVVIDDTTPSDTTTYSSNEIDTKLSGKQDTISGTVATINDTTPSDTTTYSSNEIENKLSGTTGSSRDIPPGQPAEFQIPTAIDDALSISDTPFGIVFDAAFDFYLEELGIYGLSDLNIAVGFYSVAGDGSIDTKIAEFTSPSSTNSWNDGTVTVQDKLVQGNRYAIIGMGTASSGRWGRHESITTADINNEPPVSNVALNTYTQAASVPDDLVGQSGSSISTDFPPALRFKYQPTFLIEDTFASTGTTYSSEKIENDFATYSEMIGGGKYGYDSSESKLISNVETGGLYNSLSPFRYTIGAIETDGSGGVVARGANNYSLSGLNIDNISVGPAEKIVVEYIQQYVVPPVVFVQPYDGNDFEVAKVQHSYTTEAHIWVYDSSGNAIDSQTQVFKLFFMCFGPLA